MTSSKQNQRKSKPSAPRLRPEEIYPHRTSRPVCSAHAIHHSHPPAAPPLNATFEETVQWAYKVLEPMHPRDGLLQRARKLAAEAEDRGCTPRKTPADVFIDMARTVQRAAHNALERAQVPRRIRDFGGRGYDVVYLGDGGPPFCMCCRCGWYSHDKASNDAHMKECRGKLNEPNGEA